MILGHGGLELRARAFIAEVKCYLCSPSFSGTPDMVAILLMKFLPAIFLFPLIESDFYNYRKHIFGESSDREE